MPLIKARDLRDNIRIYGFEQGVVLTLEALLDEYAGHRQHMRELTELASQCIDHIEKFLAVSDSLTKQIDKIKRERDQHDESTR
jgi:hypothetical protein